MSNLVSRVSLAGLVVFCASGCMSLAGDRLPKRSYAEIVPKRGRVAIDYGVSVQYNGNEIPPEQKVRYKEGLDKVANTAACFSSFREGTGSPWHLDLTFNNTGGDNGTAILCGLTLFVFPAIVTEEYNFTAVLSHKGQHVKTYAYVDSMTTFMEILLIFVSPFMNPISVGQEVNENIVRNFFYELANDNLLSDDDDKVPPASSRPSAPATTTSSTPDPTPDAPVPNAPSANAPPVPDAPPAPKDDR